MFRILPVLSDGKICIPWYTLVVFYGVEVCLASSLYGMTKVNTMTGIGVIPEDVMLPIVATIIVAALVMYMVFYLMAYQAKKSDVLAKKAKALEAGEPVDSVAIASIENFHTIYIVAMALGVIVTSAIALVMMATVVGSRVALDTQLNACVYAALTTIVVFVLFDKFVGRKIADGTFRTKVLNKLQQAIINKYEIPEVDEEQPAEEAAVDDKQVQLIAQLLSEITKKQ